MNAIMHTAAALAVGIASVALAQEQTAKPQVPEDAFSTRELIAWSSMQKPQPAPQPLPPRDTPIPQPEQQRQAGDTQPGDSSPSTARTFVGKVLRSGRSYLLESDTSTTYQLENTSDVAQFEDKNVRIQGVLDSRTNTIHVTRIALLT